MHQDIANKRPTEVDFLTGEVVKIGEAYEFETPKSRVLTELIHAKVDILGIRR